MNTLFHEAHRSRAATVEKLCLAASALLVICAVTIAMFGD